MRYNIFQDNQQIRDVVAKTLGYPTGQEYNWFTEDIFFQSYFYLSQRFGFGKKRDDYKDAGVWAFNVKNYTIQIRLNCSNVIFMVFGEKKIDNHLIHSPYDVKRIRLWRQKERLLIPMHNERTPEQDKVLDKVLGNYLDKKGISHKISKEEWNEKYAQDFWFREVSEYNQSVMGISYEDYEKYGEYSNAKTRHALRTLEQFIQNMLTPIWVRDVPYNIKGRLSDEQVNYYWRYEGNIKIELKK